jgi:hypothetical protein
MNVESIRDPSTSRRRALERRERLCLALAVPPDPWPPRVRCDLALVLGAVAPNAGRRHLLLVVLPLLLLRNHGYRPAGNTFLTPESAQPFGTSALHRDRCSTCCAQLGLHFCPVRRQLRRLAHH